MMRVVIMHAAAAAMLCATATTYAADSTQATLIDDPSCSRDQTEALRHAIATAAGAKLVLPKATICLKTAASTIKITAPNSTIEGQGAATIIKWAAPAGSPIAPIIDVLPSAKRVTLHDIAFDHNATGGGYVDPTYFAKDPWGGVAVSIQADDFNGYNLWAQDSFDNCIGIAAMDPKKNIAVRGSPQRFTLNNIHTEHCGSGVHSADRGGPGKLGSGINVGAGSAGVISNAVDFGSYCSFAADIGGGASASWSNITSFYARVDRLANTPALYVGSPNNSFANVSIIQPAGNAIWSDFHATGTQFANVNIKGPGRSCLYIKGPGVWNNVTCSDPSFAKSGASPAILIDSTAGAFENIAISGLNIITTASMPSYAIDSVGTQSIPGSIAAFALPGAKGVINAGPALRDLYIESQRGTERCSYDSHGVCTPAHK